jgi:hypothetical protein
MIQYKFKIVVIYFCLIILNITTILAATCDYTPLYTCQDDLKISNANYITVNQSLSNTIEKYNDINTQNLILNKSLNEVSIERDHYKELYLNSSLDKISVGDFLSVNESLHEYYVYVDKRIYSFNSTLNDFSKTQNTINKIVNISFYINIALSLTLFGFGFYLFKKLKYFNQRIETNTKIIETNTNIITQNEKHIHTHKEESRK